MSTDEINDGTLKLPAALDREAQTVNSFQTQCHEATQVVLSRLAEAVDLPLLTRHHQGDKTSESGLKLIAEPSVALVSNVLENKHRDSGTLTLLFYDTWSIHICLSKDDEEAEDWTFVPPPPEGCALVHGANSLARLSGGRLKSPLHRVTQPSDGAAKRYFLSYFLRPEHRLREEWEATDAATVAVA